MDHVHFAASPIHGIGVFASEDIEPGTKVMQEKALWVVDILTFSGAAIRPRWMMPPRCVAS